MDDDIDQPGALSLARFRIALEGGDNRQIGGGATREGVAAAVGFATSAQGSGTSFARFTSDRASNDGRQFGLVLQVSDDLLVAEALVQIQYLGTEAQVGL